MKKLIASVTTAGLLTLGAAGTAAAAQGDADGSGPEPTATEQHRHHPRRAALRIAAGAAAEATGVSVPELRDAVRRGQSVASVAEARGVDPEDVEQAIVSALTDALDRAVTNGRVSAERAARVKERIPSFAERVVNNVPRRFQRGGTEQTSI